MLFIEIDSALAQVFPEICVSAIRVTGLAAAANRISAAPLLAETAATVVADYGGDSERLTSDPRVGVWREAYRRVNAKPSKFRSSIEALARRALKGQSLEAGISAVDLYNAVSLRHRAPLGAMDVDRLAGNSILLRYSKPDDQFDPIGSHPDGFSVVPPVAVYAASDEILCWGFNCRDSRKTALCQATTTAVFVAESIDLVQRACAAAALCDLGRRLRDAGAIVSEPATTLGGWKLGV